MSKPVFMCPTCGSDVPETVCDVAWAILPKRRVTLHARWDPRDDCMYECWCESKDAAHNLLLTDPSQRPRGVGALRRWRILQERGFRVPDIDTAYAIASGIALEQDDALFVTGAARARGLCMFGVDSIYLAPIWYRGIRACTDDIEEQARLSGGPTA